MEAHFKRMEKIVGVFVLSIAMLLLAVIISIGRGKDWFQSYVTYYTIFDESYNIEKNTPVKLFKANIGKVEKISLTGNKVQIKLAILEEYASRIRSDSFAIVESPTFIGSEYVSIRPGNPELPQISEGGIIPGKAKRSISDLLTDFQVEKTAKMLIQAIQDLSDLVQALRQPSGPLFGTLDNVQKTTANLQAVTFDIQHGKGTVGNLLKSTELIESVHDKLDKVENILADIRLASGKAPQTMDLVQENLSSIKKAVGGLDTGVGRLNQILVELDKNLDSVRTILKNLEKGSQNIPAIIQSTEEGIGETRKAVENVDRVFQSLQRNFLIRPNLPPVPEGEAVDAGLRR